MYVVKKTETSYTVLFSNSVLSPSQVAKAIRILEDAGVDMSRALIETKNVNDQRAVCVTMTNIKHYNKSILGEIKNDR